MAIKQTFVDISGSVVLVVDDNSDNLQVVGNLLKDEPYQLQFSMSGAKALEVVAEDPPDMILLDINMPDMDGFEVCRRIQQMPGQDIIPVIFLTAAYKDKESITKGFEMGGVDYVTKPFYTEELKARIRTHLQLKKYRDYLEILSFTDPLTTLNNRRSMIEKLRYQEERTRRSGEVYTLIMADIDYFKHVNDDYGHDCGDMVLKEVAAVFSDGVRHQDSLARWGGEEFLFLLPDTDIEGGVVVAEKLRSQIESQSFVWENEPLNVTITMGVASSRQAENHERCISLADAALYTGKESGRNRVVVHE